MVIVDVCNKLCLVVVVKVVRAESEVFPSGSFPLETLVVVVAVDVCMILVLFGCQIWSPLFKSNPRSVNMVGNCLHTF